MAIVSQIVWWTGFGCWLYVAFRASAIMANSVWCATMLTWMMFRKCSPAIRGIKWLRLLAVVWLHEFSGILRDTWPAESWSINGYELKNPFGIPRKVRTNG